MKAQLDIGVYGGRGIPSTYSGYETFLTVLLPELARRGHRVTMYCRRGAVDEATEYQGVEKRFLPALEGKQSSTMTHGALSAVSARARRHDVVFAVNVANASFALLGRMTGQPVVLNTDGQEWLRGKWGRLARSVFRNSARLARFGATALIADCIAMADVYAEQFGAASTVIPYCWTELVPGAERAVCERLGVAPDGYALIAGRLVPENNAVPVAEAYVASQLPWPLLVLGAANYDSPVKRALLALAESDPRIRLLGHVGDRSEYAALVRGARLYLHGHSVGGINPSLLEAMGVGANIYAYDTPFSREALGGAGRYFPAFGPELTTILDGAAVDPAPRRQAMRQAAADRVRQRFSLEAVADAHEELFQEVVRRGARAKVAMPTLWSEPETTDSVQSAAAA
jgi:glycosyltransferase involved in cell wall biosynthesis